MINLLQAIFIAAILTTACLADGTDLALASAVGRQLLQASGASRSQCGWGFNGVPGTCSATNFGLLSYNDTVYPANYPARAQAFLTAGNVYCSQFNSNVKSCTWPCFNNNQACVIADELTNTVWDCPNSKGRAFFERPEAPHLTQAWCGTLPNCTYTPQKATNNTNRACEASFYANMSSSERLQFGPNYFVRIARELVGCCKGSNYRYAKNKMCSNATSPDECKKIKGCRFDDFYLNCKPSPQQLIKLLFEQNPKDPLNKILQAIATECDAIKDQATCNNYKPVQVDKGKIYFYLNQNLDTLNTPVSDKRCRPQNIFPPSPPAAGKRMRTMRRHALA